MALIACQECGKRLSSEALVCPDCGKPLRKPPREGLRVTNCGGCLALCILIPFFGLAFCAARSGESRRPEPKTVPAAPSAAPQAEAIPPAVDLPVRPLRDARTAPVATPAQTAAPEPPSVDTAVLAEARKELAKNLQKVDEAKRAATEPVKVSTVWMGKDEFGHRVAKGVGESLVTERMGSVFITVLFFDTNDVQVGDSIATIPDVGPGVKFNFEARCLVNESIPIYRVTVGSVKAYR